MSLNAKLYKYIGYIAIILSIGLLVNHLYKDKRSTYERFLKSKYSDLPNYTNEELENIPKPEHPHMGTFQNFFMTLDPDLGYAPSERLVSAVNQRAESNETFRNRDMNWTNIQSNMGGRTRSIMFDPNDENYNKVWAGSVSGGLWLNNDISDENSDWLPVNDFWQNLSVSVIVSDPNNNNIFYVGTGEANTASVTYRESSSKGVGIWKTVDAGSSWELLSSTTEFDYITDIAIKSTPLGSEIYAGVASGIYQGEIHQSEPSDGLYKSLDGGLSWNQVLPNISSTSSPYVPSDIEISTDGRIFVGTMKNLDGNGGASILFSDTGEYNTWIINNNYQNIIESDNEYNIPGRIVLSSCENSPNIIYGVVGSGYINNMNFNLSHGNYIIKSTNSGAAWTNLNLPTNEGNQWASLAWHALTISVHPENPNIIFVGGLELYRSDDGGSTWIDLSEWDLMYSGGGSRYVHADIHRVEFKPDNSSTIAVTSDGGIFYSTNALDINDSPIFYERNKAYNTLQFYTCDISPLSQGNIFVGGLQDNGTLITGSFNDNEFDIEDMISGGDGAYCFFDNNEPLLITSTYYNYYFLFNTETNDFAYANGSSGIFINPADYDSDNNTIYANKVRFNGTQSNRLLKINNFDSDNLSSDNIDFSTINIGTNSSVYFSSLKLSPYDNTLFAGNQSGRLFKIESVDNNPATYEIGSTSFPTANISSIDIGLNNNEIVLTFSNYGVSSIWFTNDGGDTWVEKEGNLPDMPVRWIIIHNDNTNYAIIATEIGIWETNNLLSENVVWHPSNNGIGNVRVDMLSIRDEDNLILAATHGRGLYHTYYNIELIGDLNVDNNLDVLDVILMVNLVINNNFDIYADMNNDNILNVLDIVLLVNTILDN